MEPEVKTDIKESEISSTTLKTEFYDMQIDEAYFSGKRDLVCISILLHSQNLCKCIKFVSSHSHLGAT